MKENEDIKLHSEVGQKWRVKQKFSDQLENFKSHLKDLMLTFPTILIILKRKEEALYYLENWLSIWKAFNYYRIEAILHLMIASLYLNDKTKSYTETWEKAYKAMNLFIDLEDKEGKAETNFLLDIIISKKEHLLHKNDSLRLKGKIKSENSKVSFDDDTELFRSKKYL